MKTFKSAGVSRLNGKMSFRATNRDDPIYPNILKKDGHIDIHIVLLKTPMTKEDARKYLATLKYFQTPELLDCLKRADKEEKKQTKAAKAKVSKPVQAKKPATAKKKAAAKPSTKKPAVKTNDDVPNAERTDDDVDVGTELGIPAFAKHLESEG
ncbi:MAG: hypothetical protein ACXV2C_00405 [Candidatus Bathyarchaeia archaeon]